MPTTLARSAVAATTLLLAVPAAAGTAVAAEATTGQRVVDATVDVEPLRLECAVRSTAARPVVACHWSEPEHPRAAGVQLYRLAPELDDARQVVFRTRDLRETSFVDRAVRAGHRYAYAVVAVDAHGEVVSRSRVEWVRVPPADDRGVEIIRLSCALGSGHATVGCEWSAPQSSAAAVVSLWRSVDGGRRVLVEQFRPEGPFSHRDPVADGASVATYAIVVTTADGRVVGRSRPETVRFPRADASDRATDGSIGREVRTP